MSEKEICDLIDLSSKVADKALEIYKLAIAKHNYYQRLLLLEKLNQELKKL